MFSRKGYDKKSKNSVVVKYLDKKNIIYVNNKMINVSSSIIKKDYLKDFNENHGFEKDIERILDNNKAKNITSINLKINLI